MSKQRNSSRPRRSSGPSARSRDVSDRHANQDAFRQRQLIVSVPRRIITLKGKHYTIVKDLVLSSLTGNTYPTVLSNGTQGTLLEALTLSFVPFSTYSGVFNNTDHTAFTGLFDSFQLDWVQLTFIPNYTMLSDILPNTASNNVSEITVQVDYTDTATPTSYYALQGYDREKKVTASTTRKFSIAFIPCVLNQLQVPGGSSATAQYSMIPFPMMPTASVTSTAGVQIFGIKLGINPYNTNQAVNTPLMYWNVMCRTSVTYYNQK
jgi:hypothetical protein